MAAVYLDENSGLLMYKKDGKMTPVSTNAVFFPEDCIKFYTSEKYKQQLLFKDMTGAFLPVVNTNGDPVTFAIDGDVRDKQPREDLDLKTSNKTIVGAINELALKSGSVSFSYTYPPSSLGFVTYYETLTTLPAGTYTITGDIEVGTNNIEIFRGACLVLGPYSKPQDNASEIVIAFNEEFTLEKDTKIDVAYAVKDYVIDDLLSLDSPDDSESSDEQTITISNIEIIPKSKMAVMARVAPQPPVIGVAQDTDGVYYWTLNDEWLLDDEGNKLPVSGKDGKDGQDGQNGADGADGQNGQDGVTPQLKIENDYWYISYDNGATWTQLSKATGEDGEDGESFFTSDQAETIKTLLDTYEQDLANKVSVYDYNKTVESLTNQIIQLTEKLTTAETLLSQLNSIDLSGLAVAYPKESND